MTKNFNVYFIVSASIILFLVLSILGTESVFADTSVANDTISCNEEEIWEYTVTDKDGMVKETGYMPLPKDGNMLKYSWKGITLSNAETATFKPAGKKGLKAEKGTTIKCEWRLDKFATYRVRVDGITHGYKDGNGFREKEKSKSITRFFNVKYTDYFVGKITNLSSDDITINSFSITF